MTELQQQNQELAQRIDHTKLMFLPDEDETQAIRKLCAEADAFGFFAVCVRPEHIELAKRSLTNSEIRVAAVIDFPLQKVQLADERSQPTIGQASTADKLSETRQALHAGADELDLVMNVGQLKQDLQTGSQKVLAEFQAIREAAGTIPIKAIIEIDLLSPEEILTATDLCVQSGMNMVKTSTGMIEHGQGARLEVIHQIADRLSQLNSAIEIKASGGIKTRTQALLFLAAGVHRIGTSSGPAFFQEQAVAADSY
jgi:deoxyribose-phosphate aldolase